MSEQMEGWVRNPDGSITTNPMLGWSMAAFPGAVVVRLDVKKTGDTFETEPFQFHVPAEKVREFAEALIASAEQAGAAAPPPSLDPYSGL